MYVIGCVGGDPKPLKLPHGAMSVSHKDIKALLTRIAPPHVVLQL